MTSTTLHNTSSLSEDLRTHTAQAHEEAEHSTFMNSLLKGELTADAFIRLQEQSWLFYTALEAAARACAADPRAVTLIDPRLERKQALENDLDALHGNPNWRNAVEATEATAVYIERLDEIGEAQDFPRLVAHHYVRYLGDLSGGQIIARMVNREYGVEDAALSFYRFDDLGKLKPYKDNYRDHLNALTLSEAERAALMAEASDAFRFNQQVFKSLD
ncbi:Heme oxygenase [Corynebacterium deserti GIMN1.010]|uniref:heme oxygenase (biliverdin-producing) n=1 Tax=Corynebacterium deserti GIMN1.010 TaxID=931089 RepID=A0A0M4CKD1_9CORY|nr:biliverdin-producing heme oxygenase [Corynebacterium deserti]ALC06401.1 Heme oxygenase [Corynebacterium deserti GIMN1.010]